MCLILYYSLAALIRQEGKARYCRSENELEGIGAQEKVVKRTGVQKRAQARAEACVDQWRDEGKGKDRNPAQGDACAEAENAAGDHVDDVQDGLKYQLYYLIQTMKKKIYF